MINDCTDFTHISINNTTNPTNPPLPNWSISAVRLATTSKLKIAPPVKMYQRIETGTSPIKNDPIPLTNPFTYLNTESMFFFNFS